MRYGNRTYALIVLNYHNFADAVLDEAIADYDQAIVLQPNFAEAYFNRGIARDDQMKLEEASPTMIKRLD